MHFSTEAKLLMAVAIASALMLYPAGMVNEALLWDDKAYINNALIASGRISPDQAWGPHAEERPPLFWWLITGFFLLGFPTWIVRLVSPTFGVLAALGIFTFTSRVFRDVWAGFSSALLLSLSWFYVSTSSDILSDVMGATLSTFYVLCICLGLTRRLMLWLSGPFLALSIMARDTNLLLIPASIVFLVWTLSVGARAKLIALASLLLLVVVPLVLFPSEQVLQYLSASITPLLVSPLFISAVLIMTGLSAIVATHPSDVKTSNDRQVRLGDIVFDAGFAFFLASSLLFPYFIDNYRLGQEYQIEGKGVLSRPISHIIMAKTIGIGADLPASVRWIWWTQHSVQLATVPVLMLAVTGAVLLLRSRQHAGRILVPWAVLSLLYVILFTHLEERFLVQSLPTLFILMGYTISKLRERSRSAAFLVVFTSAIFLVFPSLPAMPLPDIHQTPPVISAFLGLAAHKNLEEAWLTPYLDYLSGISSSTPRIQDIYPIMGVLSLILLIVAIYIAWRKPTL